MQAAKVKKYAWCECHDLAPVAQGTAWGSGRSRRAPRLRPARWHAAPTTGLPNSSSKIRGCDGW
jgi:hypothetical protein